MVNQPKTTEDMPEISVIVPVYKEEENTRPFIDRMENVLHSMKMDFEILFSLDPSPGRTEEVIGHHEINILQPVCQDLGIFRSVIEAHIVFPHLVVRKSQPFLY